MPIGNASIRRLVVRELQVSTAGRRQSGVVLAVDVDVERLREVCERYGVASLEIFGSAARGDDMPESDVDLLHVLKPDARLGFRIFDLEDELAALFGRPVDLVSRKSINKYIREQVLADAQPLYAA
jgi:predicted nucleotidyltransferase